ncbi:flagellar filament capping protein FliD [Alkalimonas delamerensis]|uniref:Flagellar hook-associated protein 2 n=1 Tax=Alkalimonas delamerensis TaxID=265981 RepID=A0ABT9GNF7_9GAMM|nr:flagellar filament capping protein FliD [Alkalimonas delamerensis]MDP4528325.1 flagellar filament capping protein FliD [Alkalimonas delamerensis]
MSQVNFLGSASGLPLEELVSTLVKVERDSKLGRINKTKSTLEASLSGVGRLKSALSSFQNSIKALGGNNLKARVATITQPQENKTFLEASASNSAVPGSFDVKVNQLAAGSRLESADGSYDSANDVVSTTDGVITLTAGDKSFDVNVTAGMTLNQLRQKINGASDNFGVNVNLINAGGAVGTKLVFSSGITGDGNDLQISNNNAELDSISTIPTGASAGLSVVQAAQNAEIEIDGILASSNTNVFSNVIQDVSLTVRAVTPDGNNAALNINTDKEGAEEKINAFIKSYNELVDQIDSLTKNRTLGSDGKTVTAQGGPLAGDPLPRSIMSQLRGILGSAFEDADEGLSTLYSMGITFNSSGKLEIASTSEFGGDSGRVRFNRALDENFDGIASLFGGDKGLSASLEDFTKQFTQSGGIIATRENSLRGQIDKSNKDLEAANRFIQSYEQTLRSRYTALDGLLGSMQNMASTITAQLSNLPGFRTQTTNRN